MNELAKQNEKSRFMRLSREKRDKINARNREKRNCPIYRAKRREYKARRAQEIPSNRIKDSLRTRLRKVIKGGSDESIRSLIGCSWEFLKLHLESKFNSGMNWENYGKHWHIDHIVPCVQFDHSDDHQVKACWHWSNLAPLEAEENVKKGGRIEIIPITRRVMVA
jgi:hypothetical protein